MSFLRRVFLQSAPAPLWLPVATVQFPGKLPFRGPFPLPADGASVGINPPGFGGGAHRAQATG